MLSPPQQLAAPQHRRHNDLPAAPVPRARTRLDFSSRISMALGHLERGDEFNRDASHVAPAMLVEAMWIYHERFTPSAQLAATSLMLRAGIELTLAGISLHAGGIQPLTCIGGTGARRTERGLGGLRGRGDAARGSPVPPRDVVGA